MRFTFAATLASVFAFAAASPVANASANESTLDIAARATPLTCGTGSVTLSDAYRCAEWLVNDRPDELLTAFGTARDICSVDNYGTAYWSLQNGPDPISATRREWGNAVYAIIDGCRHLSNTHTGGTIALAQTGPLSGVNVFLTTGPRFN